IALDRGRNRRRCRLQWTERVSGPHQTVDGPNGSRRCGSMLPRDEPLRPMGMKQMMKLVLLRHGESQWNEENRFSGWKDIGLTAQSLAEGRGSGQVLEKEGHAVDPELQ